MASDEMPRPPAPPQFPDSPGKWLAWFRLRGHTTEGERLTPGEVGKVLGVSEATVRRWESDLSRPRLDDLLRLSKLYGFTPLEEQFMVTAVTAAATEQPPDPETFAREARDALSVDLPACLLDSLFYLRAWNSYAVAVQRPASVQVPHIHPLAWGLSPNQVELWDTTREAVEHRGWRRVLEFWLLTARLCGIEAYRSLIRELSEASPLFRERWLASDRTPADLSRPIGTVSYVHDDVDMFRRIPLSIVLPPVYHLRLYVPSDDKSEAALKKAREQGPPRIFLNDVIHWSLQPA